jgi:hypothetical protein
MATRPRKADIDPDLQRLLQGASATSDSPIEVVFVLKSDPAQDHELGLIDGIDGLANRVVHRVETKVGRPVRRLKVFHTLGAFAVSASPSLIKALLQEPEIESAMANSQSGWALEGPLAPG